MSIIKAIKISIIKAIKMSIIKAIKMSIIKAIKGMYLITLDCTGSNLYYIQFTIYEYKYTFTHIM